MAKFFRNPSTVTKGWTDAREDDVRRLWMEGKSASEIAKALGGTTRSAVLGVIHRRGFSRRELPASEAKVRGGKRAGKQALRIANPAPIVRVLRPEPPPYADALDLSIHALTLDTCRYLTGGEWGDPRYCGVQTQAGSSYCPHHHAMCWQRAKVAVPALPASERKGMSGSW